MNENNRARRFLQDININSDVLKTLDDLVKEKLRHHLVMSPNTGVKCNSIMLKHANTATTEINALGPEIQVSFLLEYGSSEHDLTNNLTNGVSNHRQARDFLDGVELTRPDRDRLEQLVLDDCHNIADVMADDISDDMDKDEVKEIISFLHEIAKQEADDINRRSPQYQVTRLLSNGIHEDDLHDLIEMEGAREHVEMQDNSPGPDM